GDADFIGAARKNRKMVGGGMRQAGILASAGIVALTEMVDRLADDHANAHRLAEGIAELPGVEIDPATVRTNIVIFSFRREGMTPKDLEESLAQKCVLLFAIGGPRLRAVTHYGIESSDINTAWSACQPVLS
ncbi:MAG: beta-eliminating lyase-related protein, partial [Anaerolineae bacterium]